MATTVARLQAVLGADTHQFDRAMDRSHSKFGRVSKAAGIAGLAIAGGLAFGLKKSATEAMEAQRQMARLSQAFRTAGLNIKPYRKAIEESDKATRKMGFSDEDAKNALGSLIVATHSFRKSREDLNVAMDVARFKNIDLTQATKMLTMAMGGSQRATKQLGLDIPKVTTAQDQLKRSGEDLTTVQGRLDLAQAKVIDKQRTAAIVIDTVRQKLGGQAEAYSKTAAGAMAQFQVQTQELEEQLGMVLLPIIASVSGALAKLAVFMQEHTKAVQIGVVAVAALGAVMLTTAVATKIITTATRLWTAATKIAAAAQWLLNAAVEANPYVLAATAIAALIAALVVLQLKYQAVTKAVKFLSDHLYLLLAIPVVGWLATGIAYVIKYRKEIEAAAQTVGGAFVAALKPFQKALAAIQASFASVRNEVHTLLNALGKVVDLFKWIIGAAKTIGGAFGALAGAVKGAADRAGDASGRLDQARRGPGGASGVVGGSGAKEGQQFGVGRQLWDEIGMGEALGLRVTSGFRPGAHTKHGTLSDHARHAAVDMSGSARGMAALFMKLVGRKEIRQAFYDPLGSIFNGVRSSYREGGHSDHIHIAEYDKGGFLRPGWNLAFNGLGRPEPVGGDVTIPIYLGGEQIATVVFDMLRRRARTYEKRNLRGAFGNI